MRKVLLLTLIQVILVMISFSQNVFNPADPITRYDASQPLGSLQRPDPAKPGLQKWVSTPTSGVSVGSSSIDVSSFKQYFLNFNGTPMAFRVKFPKSYANPDSSQKKYPVMLFLHGAGEVGCPTNNGVYNNEKQLWLGGGLFRDFVDQNLFDGFLLYPQLVNAEGCWGAWGTAPVANFNAVLGIIDSMVKYVRADNDRVLTNGLSGGGYGAWRLADIAPTRIAKIIPSAAAHTSVSVARVIHIPIWFATGAKDPDPTPVQAEAASKRLKDAGADVRYTQYADLGHAVWYRHWREPDYAAAMNDIHKANPLVYYQHNAFCANETIAAKMGISAGFNAYEWQRDGVTIATRTGTTNTIILPQHVTSFTGNEITVKSYGIYRVRFKRTATSEWSAFSPKPVEVRLKTITETPAITVSGAKSTVLPSLDGSATVPLQLPEGYLTYQWFRASDETLVASTRIFQAPVGVYKAKVTEQFGCGTDFSPTFSVIDANGSPKPDAPTKLSAIPFSQTATQLSWTQGANETGFEVYRAATSGGPYSFVAIAPANAVIFNDTGLLANTSYFYVLRAINATGASEKSNEATAKTQADNSIPVAPSNLQYRGSTSTSVMLTWNPGSDKGGIKRYDIYANGVKMYSTTNTSFNVFNLDSLKTYTFVVKAVDFSENMSAPSNQVTGFTHRRGVNYKYFTTTANWYTLPNLKTLAPVKTGVMDSVNITDASVHSATTKYAFLWEGLIYIPATSTYTFETRSDDGSKLYIDVPYSYTAKALVNNDTIHGMRSRTGTITLTQGYHTIAVAFFQRVNGWGLELYWKNTSGLAREKIPMNFFTYASANTGNVVPTPTAQSATPISNNQVRINWTDISGETGYEIVRSTTSTGVYVPVGTTTANATSFIDSGLVHLKTYYYKIRSIADGSESPYTPVFSAKTLAAPTLTPAPSPLTALQGNGNAIILNWQDNAINEWNYRVYRSVNGTTYTAIAATKGNVNAHTDNNTVAQTVYYYYVLGYNGSGLGPKTNIVKIKAGNNAPVVSGLDNIFVKTSASVQEDFVISDEAGDQVSINIIDKPAFVNVTHVTGTAYRLTANPTQDNVGQYTLKFEATDNYGKISTTEIVITVADSKTRSVFLNFGEEGKTAKAPWNNWLGTRSAGNVIANLADENNQVTSFSVTTINGWSDKTVLGHLTGNNSGVAPDSVLESGIADNGAAKQLRIAGLDPSKIYNLKFIGSQNEGVVAFAQYTSGSVSAKLNARYNTNRSANLNGLSPNGAGEITATITRIAGSPVTYLNGLVIEEVEPSVTLLNPEHLYGEAIDKNNIALSWIDRSANESAANGYELQRATDSMFSQNVTNISLPADTTSYVDNNLNAGTKYWYRVRVRNDVDFSEYSNKFTVVTPNSIVYLNFNSTLPDESSPWNNTAASPLSEFIIDNLYNESGQLSGISMMVTKVFNGEFTAGANTGNNSGVVPDNVLAANFWIDNTQQSQIKLSGLNHTKKYRIGFVGSSSTPGWFKGNYTATYTINGRTVYLNSWMNASKAVYISNIVPDAGGEVYLDFSTTQIAQWAFNAGIIIHEYADAQSGTLLYMSNSTLDTSLNVAVAATDKYKLSIYPNPFRDVLNIDFNNVVASDKITAEVYDVAGRLVHRHHFNEVPAGNNTLRISQIRSSARGMFMVVLKVNGKIVHTRKMLRNK